MTRQPYQLQKEIIPAPGTQIPEWSAMEQKIELIRYFTKKIHIDILDGRFASNTTSLDPAPFAKYTKDIVFEAHLMVVDPFQYIDAFGKAGFTRFIGQVEKMPDIAAFLAKGQEIGEVGLAVDTDTDIDTLFPYVEDMDFALIMTVKAGFSRQSFLPDMLKKVQILREKAPFLPIEIDGGVNETTIVQARNAGATRFVTTGFVLDSPDPKHQYEELLALAEG